MAGDTRCLILRFGSSGLGLDNPRDGVNQFLVSPGDGEKTASGKRCRGADRRGKPDTRRKPETRKPRKHGHLRGYGRREALTGGLGRSREKELAPQAGLEPATLRLTAGCSTIELLRNRSIVTFYIKANANPSSQLCAPASQHAALSIASRRKLAHPDLKTQCLLARRRTGKAPRRRLLLA